MTTEEIKVTAADLTLDQLVWRRYRRPIAGLVEKVLQLNPGLAALGPFLPVGTAVTLPILEEAVQAPPERPVIQLWD